MHVTGCTQASGTHCRELLLTLGSLKPVVHEEARYRYLRRLGKGAFGSVYSASDLLRRTAPAPAAAAAAAPAADEELPVTVAIKVSIHHQWLRCIHTSDMI